MQGTDNSNLSGGAERSPQDAYVPGGVLEPFDVGAHSGRRGMMIFLGTITAVLLVGVLFMTLFSSGTRGRDQTPRIHADNSPYKEVPADRGGAQTPNQDKRVYDRIQGKETAAPVRIVNTAEQPAPIPQSVDARAEALTPPKTSANIVIKSPVLTTQKPISANSPPVIIAGDYVVQVAALRSRGEADRAWEEMLARHRRIIGTANYPDIKKVDRGAQGIFYRLRVGGIKNEASAKSMCGKLKAGGQDCIVTRR